MLAQLHNIYERQELLVASPPVQSASDDGRWQWHFGQALDRVPLGPPSCSQTRRRLFTWRSTKLSGRFISRPTTEPQPCQVSVCCLQTTGSSIGVMRAPSKDQLRDATTGHALCQALKAVATCRALSALSRTLNALSFGLAWNGNMGSSCRPAGPGDGRAEEPLRPAARHSHSSRANLEEA